MSLRFWPAVVASGVVVLSGCGVPVAASLDEGDANQVVVALDASGIDAAKDPDPGAEGKFRVMVARDDVARALSTLREEELPRPRPHGLLDAADRGQLVPSQAAEHAQLVAGLAGELSQTLQGIDGVLAARVHLNLPPRDGLSSLSGGPPGKGTASVLVEHRGATPPIAPESIQRLVAGGAPGVAPADVAVVFVPRTSHGAGGARTDLAHVGPITVARGSAMVLKLTFAVIAVVILGLAGAILALSSRMARLRRERDVEPAARPPVAAAGGLGAPPRSMHPGPR
jgi:type III secretion protein J